MRRFRFPALKARISTSPATTSFFNPKKDSSASLAMISCPDLPSNLLKARHIWARSPAARRRSRRAGLTPIAQNGFFSSDPKKISAGLPNVPVVFLRLGEVRVWAQIDTGYEDSVYARSVDINQALFDRLVRSGIKMNRTDDIDVWTCDGRESRAVYRLKGAPLTIENERGKPIVETEDFHLIVKPADACGGIADLSEPAAQLGASFLLLFRTVIFDPRSSRRSGSAALEDWRFVRPPDP